MRRLFENETLVRGLAKNDTWAAYVPLGAAMTSTIKLNGGIRYKRRRTTARVAETGHRCRC
jgi:outer membrane receptor protein involved in Fe transport